MIANKPLDDLVASGYAAQVLNKHPINVALDSAALAFVATPALVNDARAELDRLNAMGPTLERRCIISSHRRDFLAAALAHPVPDQKAIDDAAALAAAPGPVIMPIGEIAIG